MDAHNQYILLYPSNGDTTKTLLEAFALKENFKSLFPNWVTQIAITKSGNTNSLSLLVKALYSSFKKSLSKMNFLSPALIFINRKENILLDIKINL